MLQRRPVFVVYFGSFCNLPSSLAVWFPAASLDECRDAARIPQPGPDEPVYSWIGGSY